ncbi:MBL fold metallo-hydrolase [Catelliglobosispora koreensis]|uniref:MBL fold metallo-hydrolase n=1 Tax=Catelliglobosispora koreensis TaxID=129052 RepID=UPI00038168EE|nr:MBL fold metallo-hydrolase [Catelliglobosispora koreensis]
MNVYRNADVTVLNDQMMVPGIGFLPVNAFVLHSAEPVVIDTGLSLPGKADAFLETLSSALDPADVRWIFITHPDRDHTGGLMKLLEAAPKARLAGNFACIGIMSTEWEIPLDRVYLINPGQSLSVGDRELSVFRPPLFDSPATMGFTESATGVCFSSDCFGAPLPSAELASAADVSEVPEADLREGQLLWAAADSPWVHTVDPVKFQQTIDPIVAMDPSALLSSHLPPAFNRTRQFADMLTLAPRARPFAGPDQRALEELLASFEPAVAKA